MQEGDAMHSHIDNFLVFFVGEKMTDLIIDVLQTFERVLKVSFLMT